MLVLFIGTFSDENSKNLFIYICLTDFSQKWQTEIHHFKNGIFRPFLGTNLHPDDHFWGQICILTTIFGDKFGRIIGCK